MISAPTTRHVDEAEEEIWSDDRGKISFRTVIGDDSTPTKDPSTASATPERFPSNSCTRRIPSTTWSTSGLRPMTRSPSQFRQKPSNGSKPRSKYTLVMKPRSSAGMRS